MLATHYNYFYIIPTVLFRAQVNHVGQPKTLSAQGLKKRSCLAWGMGQIRGFKEAPVNAIYFYGAVGLCNIYHMFI